MNEPAKIRAGDSVAWTRAVPDYPASQGYTLAYALSDGTRRYAVSASASGDDYSISVPAATTAGWVPGAYQWIAYASKGADRYQVDAGRVVIAPNHTAAFDERSPWRKALDAMDAEIAANGKEIAATKQYAIGGRLKVFRDIAEFLKFYARARLEVEAEEARERLGASGAVTRIQVRF